MKKVTIGIAAYNSQSNIVNLLTSLLYQDQSNWTLDRIIVHSDCSNDSTVKLAKTVKSKYIQVIDNKQRRGFSGSVHKLLEISDSDITLLLNDDIVIKDVDLVTKIVTEFNRNSNCGLVTARPVPLEPHTFIEKSVIVSIKSYESVLYSSGLYHNLFTCDGKVLAVSAKLRRHLVKHLLNQPVGNVDSYMYLSCKQIGQIYRHCPKAIVYFRCPSTLKDWISWTSRNNADRRILASTFGKLVDVEFNFPLPSRLILSKLSQVFSSPLSAALAFGVGVYSSIKSLSYESWLTSTWDIVATSKQLIV